MSGLNQQFTKLSGSKGSREFESHILRREMFWYQLKPKTTHDFDELTDTYNSKYGNYDYGLDSRSLDKTFEYTFIKTVGDISDKKVLICGANSGYEINILSKLFPSSKITAVDISDEALSKISDGFNKVHANMEELPFKDKSFDVYINCRAIHSSDVDMDKALYEAIRVTKDNIVISVSNGYMVDGKIVNGMYDYDLGKIDIDTPLKVVGKIKETFKKNNYFTIDYSSEAEIFIVAVEQNSI